MKTPPPDFCLFIWQSRVLLIFTHIQKTDKMINVCCAIILEGSKILAVQRGVESSHPLKWEFPGGKIHPEESAKQCIVREIAEELTIGIEVVNQLVSVEFDYGTKQICLIPFVCKIVSGDIKLTEHIAQKWLRFDELETMDWSEADYELIKTNKERLELFVQGKYLL